MFYSRFKMEDLMVSILASVFKIIVFTFLCCQESKISTVKKILFENFILFGIFPQKIFSHKKFWGVSLDQGIFPLKKYLAKFFIKIIFSFSGKFSTKQNFPWSRNFSRNRDLWRFSTKKIFAWSGKFPQKRFQPKGFS